MDVLLGAVLRQEFGHYQSADGNTDVFQSYRRGDHSLQHIQEKGVISHWFAQQRALLSWLGSGIEAAPRPRHAIVTRVFDDTNVWTVPSKRIAPQEGEQAPEQAGKEDCKAAQGTKGGGVGRQGKRKVSPLLGMLQNILVRSCHEEQAEGTLKFARVHTPAQVLPKARSHAVTI